QRDMSRNPLFQVVFQLFAGATGEEPAGVLSMDLDSVEIGTSKFDLRFDLYETNRGLDGHLEYCSDLFSRETIERMAGHYQRLLAGIVEDVNQRLSELPLLTAQEREQLLVAWNQTDADFASDECIHEAVEAQARRAPEAVAVISSEGRITYGELDRKANELA